MDIMNAFALSSGKIAMPDKNLKTLRRFQGIPGVEILDSGRLFVCCYAGTEAGEGPGNYVVLSVSDDAGLTWCEVLYVMPPDDNCRTYDPVLWREPSGSLWLFWAQCRSTGIGDCFDGRAGVWYACCAAPESADLEWSSPRRIAEGVMMNKPIVLKGGEWALPVALWAIYPEKLPSDLISSARSNLLFSNDGGHSFELRIGPDIPERSFDEHVIVERRDASLWLLARTTYGIGNSSSADQGRSWTTPEDSALGGPCSRFALRRLHSGRLCLVNHQVPQRLPGENMQDKHVRQNLTVWLSDDDGKTWYGRLMLDSDSGISYPDIAEGRDGFIYVVYDQGRTEHGRILLSRFTEQDVTVGELVTSGSYARIVVSALI